MLRQTMSSSLGGPSVSGTGLDRLRTKKSFLVTCELVSGLVAGSLLVVVVVRSLFVRCLFVVCCLLFTVYCLLFAVCCLFFGVCYLLYFTEPAMAASSASFTLRVSW